MAVRAHCVARLRRACARERALILTYDDGPSAELTPRIQGLIEQHGARGTFLCMGRKATEHGGLIAELVRRGHEVGSHSEHHRHGWRCFPMLDLADAVRGDRSVRRFGGEGLYRPPFGKLTFLTMAWALLTGRPIVWWTINARDTRQDGMGEEEIASAVRDNGGGVVLMHDFYESKAGDDQRAEHVVRLTLKLLEVARDEGLRVIRFKDLEIHKAVQTERSRDAHAVV